MKISSAAPWILVGIGVVGGIGMDSRPFGIRATATGRDQQSSQGGPLPAGQLIEGRDGDTIVLDGEARVRVLRRRSAAVRAVFNPAGPWLVLVVDYTPQAGEASDGRADATYTFREVSGAWPFGERWDGTAVLEEYSLTAPGPRQGLGVRTSQGLVQLFGHLEREMFQDPAAIAVVSFRGSGMSAAGGISFEQAEQRAVEDVIRDTERNASRSDGMRSTVTSFGVAGGVPSGVATLTMGVQSVSSSPIRVGGNVAQPQKIHDVPPVTPETALRAGIRGVVILELTIGTDGAVTDARVLRSIPLLDTAAVEAALQWRYEPVLVDGKPVSVIMTAAVTVR
jgi:TonB family protein